MHFRAETPGLGMNLEMSQLHQLIAIQLTEMTHQQIWPLTT